LITGINTSGFRAVHTGGKGMTANREQFAATWHGGITIPERDDAVPLCLYCCTEPTTDLYDPYCSAECVASADAESAQEED
jgi:hypothetical protein